MPEVEVLLTGDTNRVPARVRHTASANAVFTGWLPYSTFLGELLSADAVAVFSTDPHIMNRAAFESVGLGRPLVLSDHAGLRERFGAAALFAPNRPAAMADAGILVDSSPLQPPQTATTVRVRDGEMQLSDGPFAEIKEQLGGYYILDCGDLDTALRYAAAIPSARYGSVEVRPLMVMGPRRR